MARNHARIHVAIWQDDDFLALRPSVQRLYLFLLSQPNLSHLGVLPLTLRRWAKSSDAYSLDDQDADLAELEDAGFVVVDQDAEELLVRTLFRNDGIYKQPNVFRSANASVPSVHSDKIKRALLAECDRIDLTEITEEKGKREEAGTLLAALREALSVPEETPPPRVRRTPSEPPPEPFGEPPTHARAQPLVLSPTTTPSSREVRAAGAAPEGFAEFWMAYPKKKDRGAALRAYRKALKATDAETLIAAAKRYAAQRQGQDPSYTKHASTWLNAESWADEETDGRPAQPKGWPSHLPPYVPEVSPRVNW